MQKVKPPTSNAPGFHTEKSSTENITGGPVKKSSTGKSLYRNKSVPMHKKNFLISHELTKQLQSLAASEEITIFIIMLQALHVLFYKYNTDDEICVGIPSTSMLLAGGDHPILLFNSLVPLPNKINSDNSFLELLNDIKDGMLIISEHDAHAYESEDEIVIQAKDLRLTPPTQIMLIVEDSAEECQLQFGLLQLSGEPLTLSLSKPEIQFFIKETDTGLAGTIEYKGELYNDERINLIINHLNQLLISILQSPAERVSKYNILSAEERRQLLILFNDTKTEYPREKTLVNLFEEQVCASTSKVAVIFEDKKFTYDELNKRANQVAWSLLKQGVNKEIPVPIFIERSAEMLIGMLGILKAGAAYVPIDPEYPADRISFMLEDTAAALVISSKKSRAKLPPSATANVIEIDSDNNNLSDMPVHNPGVDATSRNMAYIIYTSGSTGKPKGVMIEHQAIVDHCFGLIKVAKLENCTSFALFSPLVFDAGHSIIFTSIILGASLNILSRELIMDGEKLVSYLEKNPVDCIKIVPSVWLSYINSGSKVLANKAMIFGGETFSLKIREHLTKLNYAGVVYNHYGPTETTIGKCIHKVDLQKSYTLVPIGKPFSNTQLYVVDQWGQLVPIETGGELYISGEGIARGYLNRPDLTMEKFIENPFKAPDLLGDDHISNSNVASKVYKTGDKVRWNMDGEIEYIGRIDDQVKINGYRIEPGEIESALLQNKDIKQAAVRLCEDSKGNKVIVGYIVPGKSFNKQTAILQLQEKLPEYMIPSAWMELDHLPLTPNGKTDKKALPLPDFSELLKRKYVPPSNKIEKSLVKIWEHLLGVDRVGIYDTFFELGGNSIQAVSMFNRVRKHYKKELPPATIFQASNISQLAAIISKNENIAALVSLVPIQPKGSNAPLFCIHAGAGNVLFYNDLAKNLGTNQPVFGLRAKGIDGKEPFDTCIEEMATHYIEEIRAYQPEGPYSLAGYCLGGIIAFEMAQQLIGQGQKVDLLALFNSRSPSYLERAKHIAIQKKSAGLLPVIVASAGNFSSLSTKEKIIYPIKFLKNGASISARFAYYNARKKFFKLNADVMKFCFDYYLSKGKLLPRLLRSRYLLHQNGYMSRAYQAGVYPGKMIIFRSPQIYKDRFLGWEKHVSGTLESYNVPGKYTGRQEIMNEPFVKIITSKLETILKPL